MAGQPEPLRLPGHCHAGMVRSKLPAAAVLLHSDVSLSFAGNLLVLKDGRVGFIDFGIVGKISPVTFQAMEAFLMSSMTADYNTMARALITMGVTQEQVVIEVLFSCNPNIAQHCLLPCWTESYSCHCCGTQLALWQCNGYLELFKHHE